MRLIPIECIKENSILARDIYGYNNEILLTAGSILTRPIINKINNLGIFSLYIKDDYTSLEIDDIIKPELRQKAINTIKETFSNIKTSLNKDIEYWNSLDILVEQLITDILNNKHTQISLIDIKNLDNYTYSHCVNVAAISLVIGIGLQLSKNELKNLCTGALIHDIGKLFIPPEILQKNCKLTKNEYEIMKTHSQLGFDFSKQHFNSDICLIILQHHERFDGLGYPNNLDGNNISLLSKIVSIADVYDALTSDRPYKRAFCPNDAVEYIMSNAGTLFDFDIVNIFSKIIIAYPSGTIVLLSTGDTAIVEKTLPYYPLRPVVKIIKSTNKNKINTTVNLIKSLSIVISEILYDI